MSPLAHSLIALAFILGATILGIVLRSFLPGHHMNDDSKDAVRIGAAFIATLAAIVLGLLIASAKGNYDTIRTDLGQISLRVMQLDHLMADYGPETSEIRDLLHSNVISALQQIWPEEKGKVEVVKFNQSQSGSSLRTIRNKLLHLSPHDDTQRWLKSRALQLISDINDTRWLLFQQTSQTSQTSLPFLARQLLIFWLMFLFFSFGLYSPRNTLVIMVLFICAFSASGALLLILELNQPYQGFIKISSEPLRYALAHMGQ